MDRVIKPEDLTIFQLCLAQTLGQAAIEVLSVNDEGLFDKICLASDSGVFASRTARESRTLHTGTLRES